MKDTKFTLTKPQAVRLIRESGEGIITPFMFSNGHMSLSKKFAEWLPENSAADDLKKAVGKIKNAAFRDSHDLQLIGSGYCAEFNPTGIYYQTPTGKELEIFHSQKIMLEISSGNWEPSSEKISAYIALNRLYAETFRALYGDLPLIGWGGMFSWGSAVGAYVMPCGLDLSVLPMFSPMLNWASRDGDVFRYQFVNKLTGAA